MEEKKNISRDIIIDEIKNILFNMSPHKAPSSNGLVVRFFKWKWDLICPHIYSIKENLTHTTHFRLSTYAMFYIKLYLPLLLRPYLNQLISP